MGKTGEHNYRRPSYFEQLKKTQQSRKVSTEYNHSATSPGSLTASQSTSMWKSQQSHGVSHGGSNTIKDVSNMSQQDVDEAWNRAKDSCKNIQKYVRRQLHAKGGTSSAASAKESKGRSGWKTVRMFVSSTFHDFQCERDLLVKKVFPDLRAWCLEQKIHFVEIDLRWGIPEGADVDVALRTCLGEIERCYSDNGLPFFLSMQSERVGWVPTPKQVSKSIREEFDWIDGLSITEMEVLHGAIRSKNPNAYFLLRHPSFLQTVPSHKKKIFMDTGMPIASYKTIKFRQMLDNTFGENQKLTYYSRCEGEDAMGLPVLTGYQDLFAQQVLDFFKMRIMAHYPIGTGDCLEEVSEWEKLKEMHDTFMRNEAGEIGQLPVWDKQIADLVEYVADSSSEVPYLLKAKSGSGKSSCLSTFITRIEKTIPETKIFSHFVGAVPGSINYQQMVKRIAHFLGEKLTGSEPFSQIVQTVCHRLSTNRDQQMVIVIDAYNQLTEPSVSWLPYPLSPMVKVVITARPESGVTELIQQRYPKSLLSKELIPMDLQGKREMVSAILGNYNKKLDDKQMDLLLSKQSSSSYYWLSLACEELRIYGHFSKLTEKIEELPDDLVDLQVDILKRLEEESPQDELLVAALCFLLVSESGLLEIELLELLAEPPNLLPMSLREGRYADKLPYKTWSEIMRDLRIYVKSMGDPSEGRLKIYHATFGKAVEKFYFTSLGEEKSRDNFEWFHDKLAKYFKSRSTFERRLEEYPYHLAFLNKRDDLAEFLSDWETIRNYYHPQFSKHLSHLWSYVDQDYNELAIRCIKKTEETIESASSSTKVSGTDLLSLANICYQNGRYHDCNTIIRKIENAQETLSRLIEYKNIQIFNAEMKYIKARSAERSLHVKDVLINKEQGDEQKDRDNVEHLLMEALDGLRKIDTIEHKRMTAELENRIGMFFVLKLFSLRNTGRNVDEHDQDKLRESATEWVVRSQKTYTSLEDQIGIADTFTSLAVCTKSYDKKEEYFEKAEEIIGSAGGSTEHAAIGRLFMNLGIFHELEQNSPEMAIYYYKKYLHNSMQLFGEYHPETKRAKNAISKLE